MLLFLRLSPLSLTPVQWETYTIVDADHLGWADVCEAEMDAGPWLIPSQIYSLSEEPLWAPKQESELPASDKPSDNCGPARHLTTTSGESLSLNCPAKLLLAC